MWPFILELGRIVIYYHLFQGLYRLCLPWTLRESNERDANNYNNNHNNNNEDEHSHGDHDVFVLQQQEAHRKIHEWPNKYITLFYALVCAWVGVGFALNVQELSGVYAMRPFVAGFLLFEAVRIQRILFDCQNVHSDRRCEELLRNKHGLRSKQGVWREETSLPTEVRTVSLPNPGEVWLHHVGTILTIYGFFHLAEEAVSSVLCSYLFGEVAIVLQTLLWFVRQEVQAHRHTRFYGPLMLVATALHILTSLLFIGARLVLFGYSGYKVILPKLTHWLSAPVLLYLLWKNILWTIQIVKNGEAMACCSIRNFEFNVLQNRIHRQLNSPSQ